MKQCYTKYKQRDSKVQAYVYEMNGKYFMRPHKYATSWRLHLIWHMSKAIKMQTFPMHDYRDQLD
jgi:hypothetical protein